MNDATALIARAQLEPGWELDGTDLGAELVVLLDTVGRHLDAIETIAYRDAEPDA